MNLKKHVTAVLAVFISLGAFAYPAPQDDDPVTPLLQQYTAQVQELQKAFDKQLLPPLKSIAGVALEVQAANPVVPSFAQTQAIETASNQLSEALTALVNPILKEVDVNAFNEQYKQTAQAYGLPTQEFTLQDITDMFKGMYLISALGYFEQTKKLNEQELTVLAEIFFPQEEEAQND